MFNLLELHALPAHLDVAILAAYERVHVKTHHGYTSSARLALNLV